MDFGALINSKDNWQREAFNLIKNDLLATKKSKSLKFDEIAETHLVSIYGKPQNGKTSLILAMLGLKDEKCFEEVYDTLRAGVPEGTSSTSTAIIYTKSECDKYGIFTSTGLITSDVCYMGKEAVSKKLQEVRRKVEAGEKNADEIVHIMIPCNFFQENGSIKQLQILDLPGVNSSNIKERAHVDAIIAKYVPISSVCIIVCSSSRIQELEKLSLPMDIDWRNLPHKFMVAVTHAYNDASIRAFFNESDRLDSFYNYVNGEYSKKIKGILKDNNQIAIFPIECGQSYTKLISENLKNKKDIEEVQLTKYQILSELSSSIVRHKGQRIHAAIEELKSVINHVDERSVSKYQSEKAIRNGNIYDKCQIIKRAEGHIKQIDENIKEITNELYILEETIRNVNSFFKDEIVADSCSKELRKKIHEKFPDEIGEIYDNNKEMISVMKEHVRDFVKSVENKVKKKIEDANDNGCCLEDVKISTCEVKTKTLNFINDEVVPFLFPKWNLFQRIFRKRKVPCSSIKNACLRIEHYMFNELQKNVFSPFCEYSSFKIQEKNRNKGELQNIIDRQNSKITEAKDVIKAEKYKIDELETQIRIAEDRKQKDLDTLNSFKEYARMAYEKQRKVVINTINDMAISSEDRVMFLLLLGVLEKDYQSI